MALKPSSNLPGQYIPMPVRPLQESWSMCGHGLRSVIFTVPIIPYGYPLGDGITDLAGGIPGDRLHTMIITHTGDHTDITIQCAIHAGWFMRITFTDLIELLRLLFIKDTTIESCTIGQHA